MAVVSGIIVLNPSRYPTGVITLAATTLLVDILSLSVSIFKLMLQQGSSTRLCKTWLGSVPTLLGDQPMPLRDVMATVALETARCHAPASQPARSAISTRRPR